MNDPTRVGGQTSAGSRRPRPAAARIFAAFIAAGTLGVLAAACGGGPVSTGSGRSSSPTSSTAASAAAASGRGAASGALAMAACVRAHGVPDFPDPTGAGTMPTLSRTQGHVTANGVALTEGAGAVKAAMTACQAMGGTNAGAPPNPHLRAEAMAAARCMRSHGYPNFPDPTLRDNRVHVRLPSGIDARSAPFQRAEATCASLIPPANR